MRIVVIGGGIGGLGVALFLAPAGHDVTIVEADPVDLPVDPDEAWSRWPRRGVAQFRNIHLFNARGRGVLRQRAPAVLAAVRAAGPVISTWAGPAMTSWCASRAGGRPRSECCATPCRRA